MELNIAELARFGNKNFALNFWAWQQTDTARKKPEIPAGTIFQQVVYGAALRKKSFNQLDLQARIEVVRRFFKSQRPMVSSRTTLWRVVPRMNKGKLRRSLQKAYASAKEMGLLNEVLSWGRSLRLGALDGSQCGKLAFTCLDVLGSVDALVDLEVWEGSGKELPCAEALLRRALGRYGKGFLDLLLGDGLYITQNMLRLCREELGCHLLVKTKEVGSLNVLKDAQALFDDPEGSPLIEHVEGVDSERGVAYEVRAAGGFRFEGVPYRLKVARVRETVLKGKKAGTVEEFWVITTWEDLGALEMRELAHRRWSIENRGFKGLNEHCGTKRVWTHDRDTFEALMLMLFLGYLLVQCFLMEIRLSGHPLARILTKQALIERLLLTLPEPGAVVDAA